MPSARRHAPDALRVTQPVPLLSRPRPASTVHPPPRSPRTPSPTSSPRRPLRSSTSPAHSGPSTSSRHRSTRTRNLKVIPAGRQIRASRSMPKIRTSDPITQAPLCRLPSSPHLVKQSIPLLAVSSRAPHSLRRPGRARDPGRLAAPALPRPSYNSMMMPEKCPNHERLSIRSIYIAPYKHAQIHSIRLH